MLRVVLDGAGDRLPAVPGLIAPDGRVDPAAVAKALCAPRQWKPLWRAARRYGAARSVLFRCASLLAAGAFATGGNVR